MSSGRKASAALGVAIVCQALGIAALAADVTWWWLGPVCAMAGLAAALFWCGHYVGYGDALAAGWDDEVARLHAQVAAERAERNAALWAARTDG